MKIPNHTAFHLTSEGLFLSVSDMHEPVHAIPYLIDRYSSLPYPLAKALLYARRINIIISLARTTSEYLAKRLQKTVFLLAIVR